MNVFQHRRSSGFTIVELLIVVIVISILAAIVITSYNGVQKQAANAQTATAVKQYKDALILYEDENGEYPRLTSATSGWGPSCMGNDYGGTVNVCWNSGVSVNSYFNDQLKPYLGNESPMPAKGPFLYGGLNYYGAMFYHSPGLTIDSTLTYTAGGPPLFMLGYYIWGAAQKCPIGPVLSTAPGPTPPAGWPNFVSTNTTGYTLTSGGVTLCYIKLPQPNTP